eukprot:4228485-Prymnesium_polylepis.1
MSDRSLMSCESSVTPRRRVRGAGPGAAGGARLGGVRDQTERKSELSSLQHRDIHVERVPPEK